MITTPLARKRPFYWISMKTRLMRAACRETSKCQNWSHFTNSCRRYMVEILPIRRKTVSNHSINHINYPLMMKSDQNPDPLLRFLYVFCFILCKLYLPILLSVLYSVKIVLFKYKNRKFYIYACDDFDFVCVLSKHKTIHQKKNDRHSHIKAKI